MDNNKSSIIRTKKLSHEIALMVSSLSESYDSYTVVRETRNSIKVTFLISKTNVD